MTPSDLCKWLTVKGLHKNVITTIRSKSLHISFSSFIVSSKLLHLQLLLIEQDVDGDSFLQLSELSKEDLVKSLKCDLTFGAYNKLKNLLKEAQGMSKSTTSMLDFYIILPTLRIYFMYLVVTLLILHTF